MTKRVLIIGAGPGGLAAAMLLAKAGLDVTVVERLPQVGGRTSTIRAEGFSFDLGPTFFLHPRVLEEIFTATGRNLYDEVQLVRLDPQYRLVFGAGGELSARPDVQQMERAIEALSPGDSASFCRFLDDNRAKFQAFLPCLESPFTSWRDLCSSRMLRLLPTVRPWLSLDRELRTYFSDPRVRLAFSFQSTYLGMSPFQCPSLFSILWFLEYEHGVFHPIGGCGALTQAMARIATDLGAKIFLHEPVEAMLFNGRRATGVQAAMGQCDAEAVIINAEFARAMSRLVPDALRRRWSDRKLAKKRFSWSTFMLYLGIEGCYPDFPITRFHRPGLRAQSRRDRKPARALRRSVAVCPERLRHRPKSGPRRHEHALRAGTGDPSTPQRRLGAAAPVLSEHRLTAA